MREWRIAKWGREIAERVWRLANMEGVRNSHESVQEIAEHLYAGIAKNKWGIAESEWEMAGSE